MEGTQTVAFVCRQRSIGESPRTKTLVLLIRKHTVNHPRFFAHQTIISSQKRPLNERRLNEPLF